MSSTGGAWGNRLFAASVGAFYDWAMQRQRVAKLYLRLIVGDNAGGLLGAMDAVAEMPDGSAILDVPCGGGVTLRRQCVRWPAACVRAVARTAGVFGPSATLADARRWFTDTGLSITSERRAGALIYLDARL